MKDFPEHDKRGNERTPWAVLCRDRVMHNQFAEEDDREPGCGLSYLTEDDYEWQCEEGSSIFYCPICGEVAEFLDAKPPIQLPGFEVQTRSHTGELQFFPSVKEAMEHADTDDGVWKISFAVESGERVRLVKSEAGLWVYENILDEVLKRLEKDREEI